MEKKKIKFDGFCLPNETKLNREAKFLLQLLSKHYDIELSGEPDYIFFSVDGKEYYKSDAVRIFCTIEALCPDFNLADYGVGFEQLSYGDRYFRFPNYLFYEGLATRMEAKHRSISPDLAKREFCSFVYSNAKAAPMRMQLFETLSKYKKVDAGGKLLNNMPGGVCVDDKSAFEATHKFSIAAENASCPGYHTEKLIEAFANRTVPIYWGDPCVKEYFNEKAFVCAADYETQDELLAAVKELDEDDEKYLAMLREPALKGGDTYPSHVCGEKDTKPEGTSFEEAKTEALEEFLTHIFDQPLEEAYRRNRGFWGEQYLDRVRKEARAVERYMQIRDSKAGRFLRKVTGRS